MKKQQNLRKDDIQQGSGLSNYVPDGIEHPKLSHTLLITMGKKLSQPGAKKNWLKQSNTGYRRFTKYRKWFK